ncbi:hypothetical protein ACMYT1_12335, partial [Escherichia coli]
SRSTGEYGAGGAEFASGVNPNRVVIPPGLFSLQRRLPSILRKPFQISVHTLFKKIFFIPFS